jgi:hypothetical protein
MKRPLVASIAILAAWTLLDVLTHRLLLAPIYEASANLWRPFDQMNTALIYAVTFVLIGVFVGSTGCWSVQSRLVLAWLSGPSLGWAWAFNPPAEAEPGYRVLFWKQ